MTQDHRRAIDLVALDLDGVVWRGDRLLPGAAEALAEVVRRGLGLRYVTNNSTAHRQEVARRLAGYGLPAGEELVITSGFVTAHWLKERLPPPATVMVVGEEGLLRELEEVGLQPVRAVEAASDARAAAVVVGMDRDFCYGALAAAQEALLREEVLFVATNRDNTFPTSTGLLPGAGAIVAAVAAAAGREPIVMGKPSLALAEVLAAESGIPSARTLFVGDRLTTDIAMGRAAGMITCLVLSGVTGKGELETARAEDVAALLPDHVLEGLDGLPALLDTLAPACGLGGRAG